MQNLKKFCRQHAAAVSFCLSVGAVLLASLFDRFVEGLGLLIASSSPAFASSPFLNQTPGALTAANTALDGTGTTLLLVTAPATSTGGSLIEGVLVWHKGTNVATVVRVFWNNGSTPTVAGNNSLIAEATIPANTVSQTAQSVPIPIMFIRPQPLKASATVPERLYVSIGTAVAAGLQFTPIGGDL